MSVRSIAIGVTVLGLLATTPVGAGETVAAGRIPTVTRLVKVFSELEARLADGLAARDVAAIDATLDADFEMRGAPAPGTPIPRAEWLASALGTPSDGAIEQMSVHDFGSVAVVSFVRTGKGSARAGGRRGAFVVDCWRRDGDRWRLAVRFVSDTGTIKPGAKRADTIDKRY